MKILEFYWAAMYISEIWYQGYKDEKRHDRHYCRTRAIVLHDRILNGRVRATP